MNNFSRKELLQISKIKLANTKKMDINSQREYFEKELGWGFGYQARRVFQLLGDASSFCDGGVVY